MIWIILVPIVTVAQQTHHHPSVVRELHHVGILLQLPPPDAALRQRQELLLLLEHGRNVVVTIRHYYHHLPNRWYYGRGLPKYDYHVVSLRRLPMEGIRRDGVRFGKGGHYWGIRSFNIPYYKIFVVWRECMNIHTPNYPPQHWPNFVIGPISIDCIKWGRHYWSLRKKTMRAIIVILRKIIIIMKWMTNVRSSTKATKMIESVLVITRRATTTAIQTTKQWS